MKIEKLTCANCGSSDVLIELESSFFNKDLVVEADCENIGYTKGQTLSIEKLKFILDDHVKNEDFLMAVCCCGQCEDEQDVNIELDNGTIFSAGGTYYGPRGNEINTVDACLFELIKQPTNEYVIFYIDQDEPIHYICECHGLEYKKGNGFYEVTKTESIKSKKEIIAQRKDTGVLIFGDDAKKVFGIGVGKDFKFTPKATDVHKMFVQSTSSNRTLKDETFMIYKNSK